MCNSAKCINIVTFMPGFCLLGFFFFFKGKQKVTVVGLGNICYLGRVSLTLASFESWYASQLASQVVLVIKNPPANAGDRRDAGSIPGSGRSPGEGHGIPLQYSCLENPMDRGAWQAMVHRVAQNQTHAVYVTAWHIYPDPLSYSWRNIRLQLSEWDRDYTCKKQILESSKF